MGPKERYSTREYSSGQAVEVPLSGGRVYFYEPDSNTPKDTYSDRTHTIKNTHPVVLDSMGEATIYRDGDYRTVVTDQNGKIIRVYGPILHFVEPIGG